MPFKVFIVHPPTRATQLNYNMYRCNKKWKKKTTQVLKQFTNTMPGGT